MTLVKYKQKRKKSVTPEPFGGKASGKELHFTIQKHAARQLHYDFRLEMEGVLKSWAVPKGPSTDPEVKRLAMMVEDHPYDYRTFEGIIPEGEYGAGTVIVWDDGTYEDAELPGKSKTEQEKHLLNELQSGKVKVILHGKKLKGKYALIKQYSMGENTWLFMKMKDEYVSDEDITEKEKSVQSGKTLETVKKTSKNIYGANHGKDKVKPAKKKIKDSQEKQLNENTADLLEKAPESQMPDNIQPMLATLIDDPFDNPEWSFEVKWDGYRSIGYLSDTGKTRLLSRNNKSFTEKYYPIVKSLNGWKINAVIDSELVVINDKGAADFGALQNWRSESDGELIMYIFDLLWYEGKNLMSLPLNQRQSILKDILPSGDDNIRLNEIFPEQGKDFFKAAEELGLEGIIAKKSNSTYAPGSRSRSWLKIKARKSQEVVIGGYTLNEGSGKLFSALMLGVFDNGSFSYVGKVGTGFTDKFQRDLLKTFKPLEMDKCPFDSEPDVNEPSRFRPNPPKANAVWLKPEIVCEVNYAEITSEGIFRQPSFKGLRTDKKAKEVVREKEEETSAMIKNVKKDNRKQSHSLIKAPENSSKKTLLNPTEETQVKKLDGHDLKFTNLSKVYWPEEGITKRDMLNYYYQVAEYILPYLKDRPQSLNRFPNGINGQSFYQKNVKGKAPEWIKTFPYTPADGEHKEFLVGSDEATLLWMANLGCIEMNPWFSRIQAEDYPDFCIIDLDPDKNTFDQVVKAANEVKKVLDQLGVPSYPKTSGSTGMHIYIPLAAKYTYEQSQMFARLVANMVHQRIPEFTSVERMVRNRSGKMYLDFLQNRPGATVAGPYSLRPKPGATVSMPLHWDEVKKGMKTADFTIHNAIARLNRVGDLFDGVLGKGINIVKIIEKVQASV